MSDSKWLHRLPRLAIGFIGLSLVVLSPNSVSALSSAQTNVFNLGIDYFNTENTGSSCSTSTVTVPAGTLPTMIPEPYNGAFTQGANAHSVSPALVAAIFSEEHDLGGSETAPDTSSLPAAWASLIKKHPDPNSGWTTSSQGAQGPFQFLPSTWTGLGYNINDINSLVVAADAAAQDLAKNGGTIGSPEQPIGSPSIANAISAYNPNAYNQQTKSSWYVDATLIYYHYYSSQPGATGGGGSTTITTTASSCSVSCSGGGSATAGLSTVRQSVICLAQQELALWKSQPGYPTPAYAATGLLKYTDGWYEEWCADFVSWIYNQAGDPFTGGSSGGWRLSGVSSIQTLDGQNTNFHWHPMSSNYTPKPGDIAIYGTKHTSIYISTTNGLSTYIGGDEGNPPYGAKLPTQTPPNPPSGSIVSTDTFSGYYGGGITGYVSPD